MKSKHLIGKELVIDGDTWRVVNVGFEADGKIYLHLASTTRFRQQRNGQCPVQIADWFSIEAVK
ncbi:N-6 DNA methylase [Caudoviricetes sp.]|jgi:hypothetical protein|nr:N-6 DNA methylase [Caudoviricetes sp.]